MKDVLDCRGVELLALAISLALCGTFTSCVKKVPPPSLVRSSAQEDRCPKARPLTESFSRDGNVSGFIDLLRSWIEEHECALFDPRSDGQFKAWLARGAPADGANVATQASREIFCPANYAIRTEEIESRKTYHNVSKCAVIGGKEKCLFFGFGEVYAGGIHFEKPVRTQGEWKLQTMTLFTEDLAKGTTSIDDGEFTWRVDPVARMLPGIAKGQRVTVTDPEGATSTFSFSRVELDVPQGARLYHWLKDSDVVEQVLSTKAFERGLPPSLLNGMINRELVILQNGRGNNSGGGYYVSWHPYDAMRFGQVIYNYRLTFNVATPKLAIARPHLESYHQFASRSEAEVIRHSCVMAQLSKSGIDAISDFDWPATRYPESGEMRHPFSPGLTTYKNFIRPDALASKPTLCLSPNFQGTKDFGLPLCPPCEKLEFPKEGPFMDHNIGLNQCRGY
jgi:hypothetical protein